MFNNFFKGVQIGLGFLFVLGFFLSIVFAVGFHSANEIIQGTLQGDFVVNGTLFSPNIDANILSNSLKISNLSSSSITYLTNGYVDSFNDQTGIDTNSSINVTYDSTNNYYHNQAASGLVTDATASTVFGLSSGTPNNVIDNNGGTNAISSTFGTTTGLTLRQRSYITLDLGSSRRIVDANWDQFDYTRSGDGGANFPLSYSDDDITYTVLAYHGTSGSAPIADVDFADFDITARYWSAGMQEATFSGGDDKMRMTEFKLFELGIPYNMSLISNSINTSTTPSNVQVILDHEEIDNVTLNIDFTIEVSRDNGTTWTNGVLIQEVDLGNNKQTLSSTIDLSSQPEGNLIRYRFNTSNSKEQILYGVGLSWR